MEGILSDKIERSVAYLSKNHNEVWPESHVSAAPSGELGAISHVLLLAITNANA